MNKHHAVASRGARPLATGERAPGPYGRGAIGLFAVGLAAALGCSSKADQKAYDPVSLGMLPSDAPLYDDNETTIFQVSRPISLPIVSPNDIDRQRLAAAMPAPYDHIPWITSSDVKVQVSWTVSNLDSDPRNVEILIDPWNEFARYVPGVNVGEESTVPNLSGIDLLIRVGAMSRATGTFTFDDMDEMATDLATVQNILMAFPPPAMTTPGMAPTNTDGPNVNGMINHAFEIHNRSHDGDPLIGQYVPKTIAGLVGFDLSLRTYSAAKVAIEIVVEVVDVAGNRVRPDSPLKIDGTMWLAPAADLSAPTAAVR